MSSIGLTVCVTVGYSRAVGLDRFVVEILRSELQK